MSTRRDPKSDAEGGKSRHRRMHIKEFSLRWKPKDGTNTVSKSSEPVILSTTSVTHSDAAAIQPQGSERTPSAYVYKVPSEDGKLSAEALWEHAYSIVKSRNNTLIDDYRRQLGLDGDSNQGFDPGHLEGIIRSRLEKREAKRWMLRLGSHSLKVKEQYENVIRFVLWSDNIISGAVSAQPYLALAWSGVSMILPVSYYSPGTSDRGH